MSAQPTKPTNVIEALSRVMDELPGIGKDAKSTQGYNYRGIEQITAQVQPLLAKYGVVFVPRVLESETREIVVNGKPWTDERLKVEYAIYGPGGTGDRILAGPIVGIGRDNSDKGANKAMSQAYKYVLLQTLCIGDAKDDADAEPAHQADGKDRGAGGSVQDGKGAPTAQGDRQPQAAARPTQRQYPAPSQSKQNTDQIMGDLNDGKYAPFNESDETLADHEQIRALLMDYGKLTAWQKTQLTVVMPKSPKQALPKTSVVTMRAELDRVAQLEDPTQAPFEESEINA